MDRSGTVPTDRPSSLPIFTKWASYVVHRGACMRRRKPNGSRCACMGSCMKKACQTARLPSVPGTRPGPSPGSPRRTGRRSQEPTPDAAGRPPKRALATETMQRDAPLPVPPLCPDQSVSPERGTRSSKRDRIPLYPRLRGMPSAATEPTTRPNPSVRRAARSGPDRTRSPTALSRKRRAHRVQGDPF